MDYIITVDDGNTFCGNFTEWEDCFFTLSCDTDEEKISSITQWCAGQVPPWKLEINDKLMVSKIEIGDWVRVKELGIGEIVAVDLTRGGDHYKILLDPSGESGWYPEAFIYEVRSRFRIGCS